MVKIDELKRLRPSAWSRLLSQNPATRGTIVTGVSKNPAPFMPNSERYLLQLDGYEEAAGLVGLNTNALEATFFADLSPHLSQLTPYCWLSHVAGEQSWVVLDEVYNDWPANKWTAVDVDLIIEQFIFMHSEFWERESHLSEFALDMRLSESSLPDQSHQGMDLYQESESRGMQPGASDQRIDEERFISVPFLSEHALISAGELAPVFHQAAAGLQAIQMLGGWPGVIEEEHIEVLTNLIDDPLPVLYPLRQATTTLSHGDPGPKNWSISIFGEAILLDWSDIKIGPGINDLVSFIEQYHLIEAPDGTLREREKWPLNEETILDNYLLGMGNNLGNRFDARTVRDSIPAARCFYVLTEWLPRFNDWLVLDYVNDDPLADFDGATDLKLTELGLGEMVSLRQYLAGLFDRLIDAYHSL